MNKDRELTTLELAVIGLVSQQPRSGYDVRKVFSETALGHFSASPGAIYPALRRLEKAGLLSGKVEKQGTLRPRKLYRLAAGGERALKERLGRPVTREDIVWHMDDLMLRFAFMDPLLGREATLRFLEEMAREIEAYLPELEEQRAEQEEVGTACSRLAVKQGIETYGATARWARRAIEELS
jgi:DNA-binding PadR family transcriptional regulator